MPQIKVTTRLTGPVAIDTSDQNPALLVSVTATGAIVDGDDGLVGGAGAAWMIANAGTIGGSVAGITLASGGEVFNTVDASIYGGGIGVAVYGAAGAIDNQGTISGGTEAITLAAGGSVSNSGSIDGQSGAGIAGSGGGTVLNTTGASITGGTDAVLMSGTGIVINSGGEISGADNGIVVSTGTVTNSGTIGGGTFGITTLGGDINVANFAGATIDGGRDGIYTPDSAYVTNAGTIEGYNAAVYTGNLATVTNFAAGRLESTGDWYATVQVRSAGTVNNFGTITQAVGQDIGVRLDAGGLVNNFGIASRITGRYGVQSPNASASVINQGTIAGIGVGVDLDNGGTVSNLGPMATISGKDDGVIVDGGGIVLNDGAITATDTSASYETGFGISASGDLTVNNGFANPAASITGGTSSHAYAVGSLGTLTVGNAGTINGGISINAGTITNIAGGVIENTLAAGQSIASNADAPVVILNAGSIEPSAYDGTDAILAGTAAKTVIEEPSGRLGNGILESHGSGVSTLMLTAGAAGSLDLATLQGFDTLTLNAGAFWTLADPLSIVPAPATPGGVGTTDIAITLGATLDVSSTLSTAGVVDVIGAGSLTVNGTLAIGDGATVDAAGIGGAGTVSLGGFALFTISGPVAPTLDFDGADGTAALTNVTNGALATIAGFTAGEIIDLRGIGTSVGLMPNGNTLDITGTDVGTLALHFAAGTAMTGFTSTPDNHGGILLGHT